jgi:hypothetical protein
LGRSGFIFCHCCSLSKDLSRIPSFPQHQRKKYKYKMWSHRKIIPASHSVIFETSSDIGVSINLLIRINFKAGS